MYQTALLFLYLFIYLFTLRFYWERGPGLYWGTVNKTSYYLVLILKVAGQKEPSVQLKVKSLLRLSMQLMVRLKALIVLFYNYFIKEHNN